MGFWLPGHDDVGEKGCEAEGKNSTRKEHKEGGKKRENGRKQWRNIGQIVSVNFKKLLTKHLR